MKPSPAVVDGDLYGFCGLMEPDPKPDPFFEGIGGGLKIDGIESENSMFPKSPNPYPKVPLVLRPTSKPLARRRPNRTFCKVVLIERRISR